MSDWAPETRSRLLFVMLLGGSLAALLWFSVIAPLQDRLETWSRRVDLAQMQLQVAQTSIDRAEHYGSLVSTNLARLEAFEQRMSHGDYYNWGIMELNRLAGDFNPDEFNFRDFTAPEIDVLDLPPVVPYGVSRHSVDGRAFYHTFGQYLATLENSSPFIRVRSLELQAISPGASRTDDPERLFFRLEFLNLANTNFHSGTSW
jgi:hypothetical protein